MPISPGIGISPIFQGTSGVAQYIFLDLFTDALTAGNVNGSLSTPGISTRGVVDLDNRISISGGTLNISAAGTTGDRTAFWLEEEIVREPGRTLAFDFVSPAGSGNTQTFGLAIAKGASTSYAINVGLRLLSGIALYAHTADTTDNPKIMVPVIGTTHRIYQVLRAQGQFIFRKTSGVVKFLWFDDWDSTALLYFNIWHFGILANSYDNIAVPRLLYTFDFSSSDSFNRADGAPGVTDGAGHAEANSGNGRAWSSNVGTAAISSNALVFSALGGGIGIATVDTGNTDEFVAVKTTRSGGVVGVVTRYADANNYIIGYHDGTNFKVDKVVGGVTTNVSSKAITYVAGASAKIKADGTNVWAWYNDKDVDAEPLTIADAGLQSGTKHGVYSTDTGNAFDDFNTIPINGYSDLGVY